MSRVCGETSSQIPAKWYDPLGPVGFRRGRPINDPNGTGGPAQREAIFNYLSQNAPGIQENAGRTADFATQAAQNPGYGAASDLALRTLHGDFLNGSPQLDKMVGSVRASNAAEGANAASRIRSQYESNGLPWSTANQQAQQGAQAAGTAKSDAMEAATRLADYQNERGLQQGGVNMLNQATSAPLNYMTAADMARLAPMSQIAQIIAGLAGGGQIMKPDVLQKQSYGRQFMAAAGEVI
jgi:hypothetical protein